jgi:hypothetical protein
MAGRTPCVSRQRSCLTGISVIAESHESQAPKPERVLCGPCFAGDVASRCSWRGNATSPACCPSSGGFGSARHGTSATAFGRQRRQAERGVCRGLRQLRQHGASPARRCEPRRRAAARAPEGSAGGRRSALRWPGGGPSWPRPEAAAARCASLPSHQSRESLQAIGPRKLTLVAAAEPSVTSGVRFTCN